MKAVFLVIFINTVFAQDVQDAINSIFSRNVSEFDFLRDYEEVTPPPLKSIGALSKCGEGAQRDLFVCVPYYNCDSRTNRVISNPDIDGTNRIDIRAGDNDNKCDHYLQVCCQVSAQVNNGNPSTPPPRPTFPSIPSNRGSTPPTPPVRPTPTTAIAPPAQAFCGIRNSQGIDFTVDARDREAQFGEFPWMVAILRKNPTTSQRLSICGGSLIAPSVILTGAHCLKGLQVDEIKVRAGEWDTQTTNERIPFQERNVQRFIIHENFMGGNLYNDVALLLLDRPFTKADNVATVCLPEQDQRFDSRHCFATGWGKDVFGSVGRYAVILKKLELSLMQNADCQKALRTTRLGSAFILHPSFICAGGEPGRDTCTGDGGSPLVCPDPANPKRYLQTGMVAWGIGCGESQIPGVYVNVALFRTWIDTKLQEIGITPASYTQ